MTYTSAGTGTRTSRTPTTGCMQRETSPRSPYPPPNHYLISSDTYERLLAVTGAVHVPADRSEGHRRLAARHSRCAQGQWHEGPCKSHGFCIKNEEWCLKNKEWCLKNEELCIKKMNFVLKMMNFAKVGVAIISQVSCSFSRLMGEFILKLSDSC